MTRGGSSLGKIQCPCSSGAGHKYWTFSVEASKVPCRHFRFLTKISVRKGGQSGFFPMRAARLSSFTKRVAQGHHDGPASACSRTRRIWVLTDLTATSARPLARGSSPGVLVNLIPRSLHHWRKVPLNSWPWSLWMWAMWKPSALKRSSMSMVTRTTSFAFLENIGEANLKVRVSNSTGPSSFFSSPSGAPSFLSSKVPPSEAFTSSSKIPWPPWSGSSA